MGFATHPKTSFRSSRLTSLRSVGRSFLYRKFIFHFFEKSQRLKLSKNIYIYNYTEFSCSKFIYFNFFWWRFMSPHKWSDLSRHIFVNCMWFPPKFFRIIEYVETKHLNDEQWWVLVSCFSFPSLFNPQVQVHDLKVVFQRLIVGREINLWAML